jgi:hypothetical protein
MKSLPLIAPAGCTLSPDALAEQVGRASRLAPAVADVSRSATGLRVAFGAGVDDALIEELIATEQTCCSFLELGYEGRVLQIESSDPRGPEVMDRLAAYFGEGR